MKMKSWSQFKNKHGTKLAFYKINEWRGDNCMSTLHTFTCSNSAQKRGICKETSVATWSRLKSILMLD